MADKIKLVEKFLLASEVEDLKEKTIIKEASGSQNFSCYAVIKKVPVSRFTLNKNQRRYPRELWLLIVRNKVAEGTYCLADHPDDDGSVTNIIGIWKNVVVEGEMVYGDLWLVEGGHEYGKLFYNILRAGGKCGLSSVGYGELGNDGQTVVPETYELVRLGDWVIDPSQNVFASFENLSEGPSEIEDVRESTENSNTNLIAESSASTNEHSEKPKIVEKQKEDMEMSQELLEKQARVNEAFVESHAKQMIRLAKSKTNLVEAQGILQDLLNTIGLEKKEIREKVEVELSEITAKLEEQVKLTEKTLQEKEMTFAELSKKHNLLVESFKKLQAKHDALKEANTELVEDRELMLKDINQFITDRKLMEADLEKYGSLSKDGQGKFKVLTENVKLMESDINQFMKDRKLMGADINQFMKDRKLMEADIKQFSEDRENMQKDIDQLIEDRKNMLSDIKQFLKEREVMQKDIARLLEDRQKMEEDIKFLVEKLTKFDEAAKESEYLTYNYPSNMATSVARSTDPNEKKELSDMENPEMKKILSEDEEYDQHLDELNSDIDSGEEDEEFGEESMMEKRKKKAKKDEDDKKKMKESTSSFYKREITKFFTEETKKFPALADYEEEILSSKSLVEAVRKVDRLKQKSSDSPVRLTEKSFTSTQNDWLRATDY